MKVNNRLSESMCPLTRFPQTEFLGQLRVPICCVFPPVVKDRQSEHQYSLYSRSET